jgi:hypothetical protein
MSLTAEQIKELASADMDRPFAELKPTLDALATEGGETSSNNRDARTSKLSAAERENGEKP